jgi:putative FmdB family regulatory protein
MPIYEYKCRDCGHRFEVLQRLGQGADGLACPRCGAEPVEKVFSTFAAAGESAAASSGVCGASSGGSGFG